MSQYLTLECDPVEQPAAVDPLERATWCTLRIRIARRVVTRLWDKNLHAERRFVDVPAFPIAEWVVTNWWAILNEPCRTDTVPQRSHALKHLDWIQRHCLRAADSGALLPALYLFHDGRDLQATWLDDDAESLPHMPGEFLDYGSASLDAQQVEGALADFVSDVLDRVSKSDDERASELAENWRAIQNADAAEALYCAAAGRLGLDPYDSAEVDAELSNLLAGPLIERDRPVARDLTEVASPDSVATQWAWIERTAAELQLGASDRALPSEAPKPNRYPADYGYALARWVRECAGHDSLAPLGSVESVAEKLVGASVRAIDCNHVPGRDILAAVGWSSRDARLTIAGPSRPHPAAQRFAVARGAYHALFACDRGERLVTAAYTWDQQASRAFAAELLAPRNALVERAGDGADNQAVDNLAREFTVSRMVIERQLENAGVPLAVD